MNALWPGVDFLSMTNCLFDAHVEAMESIRAERVLDMAQAAMYPFHARHAPEHAKRWWQHLIDQVNGGLRDVVRGPKQRGALFTFNGVRVGVAALKEKLAAALGGGYSDAA